MLVSQAPPPGWYPDPRGGVRLRWWDGTDWGSEYRSRPTLSQAAVLEAASRAAAAPHSLPAPPAGRTISRAETEEIISQVRQAARAEVDRAADLFTIKAKEATRQIVPLISEYRSKALRWVRIVVTILVLLLVAYVVFQIVAQMSFFEWLGDRIDNLSNNDP